MKNCDKQRLTGLNLYSDCDRIQTRTVNKTLDIYLKDNRLRKKFTLLFNYQVKFLHAKKFFVMKV